MAVLPKIILAPLHGYTEALFREALAACFGGFDEAVAPFVALSRAERFNPIRLRDVKPSRNTRMPVVPQILGNDPVAFIQVAEALHEMGYTRLNWNLGCPKRAIAAKLRGSGLLPHPGIIETILEKVIPAIPQRVSVKLRLGRNHPDEIFPVIEVLNRFPLESVIVHPRIGLEMYAENADVEMFAKVLPLFRHPVIYNGDIFSVDDYLQLKLRFPSVAGWMMGRGALANPFLAEQIKGQHLPDSLGQRNRFIGFINQLQQHYANESRTKHFVLNRMKDNWGFFAFRFRNIEEIYRKLIRLQTLEEFQTMQTSILATADWVDIRHDTSGFSGAKADNSMPEG
ncbi:MAG TPA: tRNA-dihydrouridine synthase family protein [Bacteroidales bacterium]